jgi:hypothetical protein
MGSVPNPGWCVLTFGKGGESDIVGEPRLVSDYSETCLRNRLLPGHIMCIYLFQLFDSG